MSFIFILLTHKIYEYFKDNLTIKREIDFIKKPEEVYKQIYETIKSHGESILKKSEMKDEMMSYLTELKQENKTSLDDLPTIN
tara:strand:- start:240 stop:488 length:249 start_codon:yes stop_codon:yes gene_type:complete